MEFPEPESSSILHLKVFTSSVYSIHVATSKSKFFYSYQPLSEKYVIARNDRRASLDNLSGGFVRIKENSINVTDNNSHFFSISFAF